MESTPDGHYSGGRSVDGQLSHLTFQTGRIQYNIHQSVDVENHGCHGIDWRVVVSQVKAAMVCLFDDLQISGYSIYI